MEPMKSLEQLDVPQIILPRGVTVVLASGSPRRRELCTRMGLTFDVRPSECDETYDQTRLTPREAVEILSLRKCDSAVKMLKNDETPTQNVLVIASDTIVDLDGKALGKPSDDEDAKKMLWALSGKRHFVHTGLALSLGGKTVSAVESTAVTFRDLSEEEIAGYVSSGEPRDKAGAYAIQGGASLFVQSVDGRMDTVVGLCCAQFPRLLEKLFSMG